MEAKAMKCDICGVREAVTSLIEEKNHEKRMIHICEECLQKQENKEELRCDVCGMSYRDFLATGVFGCENCYRVFRAETVKILEKKLKQEKFVLKKSVMRKTDIPKQRKFTLEELKELLALAKKEKDETKIKWLEEEIKKRKEREREF